MKLNSVVYALPVSCTLQTSRVIRSTTPVKQPPPATDPFQYLFEFSLLICHAGLEFVTFLVNQESLGTADSSVGECWRKLAYGADENLASLTLHNFAF